RTLGWPAMTTDPRGARNWSGLAAVYADTFAHLCAGTIPALLAEARVRPDTEVLEVGTGSGLLAARLADTAQLTVTEPDPDMRAITRAALPAAVEVHDAGLPRLLFTDRRFEVTV